MMETLPAVFNPFRYRGYYYDTDTGLYYLQSRYYNPQWGRFLNEDGYISTGTGLLGYNMYAYCNNNPVMGYDPTGYGDVCVEDFNEDNNPFNDLGHPQGRGGGIGPGTAYHTYTVRCQTAAYDGALSGYHSSGVSHAMVNPGYYYVPEAVTVTDDMAVNTTRGWKVGDNIQNLTKSGNKPSWPTVHARYWKNQAYYHPELYSDNDLALMRQGKAPQIDGQPLHLHHPYGREGANYWVFYPVTYEQHHFIHYGW